MRRWDLRSLSNVPYIIGSLHPRIEARKPSPFEVHRPNSRRQITARGIDPIGVMDEND